MAHDDENEHRDREPETAAGADDPRPATPVDPLPPSVGRGGPGEDDDFDRGHGVLRLTARQRGTIAAAATTLSALVILAAVGGIFYLLGLFYQRFSHVILPVAVAGVLALLLNPYFEWLRRRMPSWLALLLVFLSLLLPLVGFFWLAGDILVTQASELGKKLPELWARISDWVAARWPRVTTFLEQDPWGQRLQEVITSKQDTAMDQAQEVVSRLLSWMGNVATSVGQLLGWAVLPVYLIFFLLADTEKRIESKSFLPFLKPETRRDVVYLANEFVEIIVAFFRGQLVIAMLQGLLFAVGFTLVGLKFGFLIGVALGFLNIVPYLGNIVGLGVALPLSYFQDGGGLVTLFWVLVVFAAVQMIEGYVLTPRIMGSQTGLHPMVIIVAIFFWGSALDGLAGMILAIPLTAFLVVFWRLAREKYIREWV